MHPRVKTLEKIGQCYVALSLVVKGPAHVLNIFLRKLEHNFQLPWLKVPVRECVVVLEEFGGVGKIDLMTRSVDNLSNQIEDIVEMRVVLVWIVKSLSTATLRLAKISTRLAEGP